MKSLNRCDAYVGLWCIYMLQGFLYPVGIINQALQLILIIWALFATFQSWSDSRGLMKWTHSLIIMYIIYGFFAILLNNDNIYTSSYVYLQSSLNSLLPIFLFYKFSKEGMLKISHIKWYIFIFIATYIVKYYLEYQWLLSNSTWGRDEFTNNSGYNFVLLMPLLYFFVKRPIIQYSTLIVVLLYTFLSMKRGAILIGFLCFIVFIIQNFRNSNNRKHKFFIIVLTAFILILGIEYIEQTLVSSDYFVRRIEQTTSGDSSGRDEIYKSVWNGYWSDSSIFQLLFGHGANSTIEYAGNFAHQDWLETLCNNGLVGFIILLGFFVSFLREVLNSKKIVKDKTFFYVFSMCLAICFIRTFMSMSIQEFEPCQTLVIGMLMYVNSRNYTASMLE